MTQELPKIRLHPESPIVAQESDPFKEDKLGFKESVIRLSSLIENIEPPFTIGIYGYWGSGKTSFMRALQAYILNQGNHITYWFDAWVYENEASLLMPLLTKLSDDSGKKQLFKKIKKIASGVLLTGTGAILKGLTLGLVDMKDIEHNLKLYEDKVEKIYDNWVSEIDNLRKEFKELIEKLRGNSQSVIIFFDDLDRCIPENVVKLIENIKHFLSIEGCRCIFIIGVDKEVLGKGIQARYGSDLINGNEYLEKIINLSLYVPGQSDPASKEFILDTAKKIAEESWFQKISDKVTEFADFFSHLRLNNPRKIRVLILRYLFFLALDDRAQYLSEIVIKLIIYRELFPVAYNSKVLQGRINYTPRFSERSGEVGYRELEYDEIERKSCKDFAEIGTNEKYRFLRSFSRNVSLFIEHTFDKSPEDVDKVLTQMETEIPNLKQEAEIIKNLLPMGYKRTHSEYFKLIDFLFSLA